MARRKREEYHVRSLNKNGGGSISVTLPIEDVRALRWRDRQRVVVKRVGKKFVIEDWKK
ncbi:MAG: hypothetical protein NUV59_02420 [Patescibacteria group bacterium]|nr:hypothetical protein [Patescibacteria group bacterium]